MKDFPASSKIRWLILFFLFIATTLLYLDRSALGIMAPFLQDEVGWTEKQYGNINSAFMVGYALCFLMMGVLDDRIGTKSGYAISVGLWAVAKASTALAKSWIGFAGTTVTGISKKAFIKAMEYKELSTDHELQEVDPIQQIVTPAEDILKKLNCDVRRIGASRNKCDC